MTSPFFNEAPHTPSLDEAPFDSGTSPEPVLLARARLPLRLPPWCHPAGDELAAATHQTVRIHGQGPNLKLLRVSSCLWSKLENFALKHLHLFSIMTRRKPVPGPQIFGDKVIYDRYIRLRENACDTALFFNKGAPNVYPSRKQVAAAVDRHLQVCGASIQFSISCACKRLNKCNSVCRARANQSLFYIMLA